MDQKCLPNNLGMSIVNYIRWQFWSTLWLYISRPFNELLHIFSLAIYGPARRTLQQDVEQGRPQGPHATNVAQHTGKILAYLRSVSHRHIRVTPNMAMLPNLPAQRRGMIYTAKGEFLTQGGTAVIERLLPSGSVIKTPILDLFSTPEEEGCHRRNMRLEAHIYQMVNGHVRVPKFVAWDQESCCLTIEYLENGNLRDYIKNNHHRGTITARHCLRWARQAAEGVQLLHSIGVVHCDISPRNFLLDSEFDLKISDFAGASMLGSEPTGFPGTRFRLPDGRNPSALPRFEDDIFSLGSLIYFIMTSHYPYEEYASDEVERLYEHRQWPDTTGIRAGEVIEVCWNQKVDITEVYDQLTNVSD